MSMTEFNKALAFAKECLKFREPGFISRSAIGDRLNPNAFFDLADISNGLDTFLAKRYLIQINRGTSTLFKWTVIVGLQDKSVRGAHLGDARADSDDLFDAVFDACVTAARADK
jgi:hypothetical protein